jgi:hypothetical protein
MPTGMRRPWTSESHISRARCNWCQAEADPFPSSREMVGSRVVVESLCTDVPSGRSSWVEVRGAAGIRTRRRWRRRTGGRPGTRPPAAGPLTRAYTKIAVTPLGGTPSLTGATPQLSVRSCPTGGCSGLVCSGDHAADVLKVRIVFVAATCLQTAPASASGV